ncbi:DUF4169 family protein [Curvivirga aplysinae]|uniref:DUF4169 family protein n=1 Tax=Curvivirga aplysinae TaxID=2529852 RepID=UPI0012BBD2D6|nr:DUF4169 family protein [Curvivirga aplysinae]MTI11488.1 DUF4169 family protein [Curvivirga aplysinae]
MSDVINLRQKRKQKLRLEKTKKAEENRIYFGQKKSEKHISIKEKIKRDREMDGKKLDK